MEKIMKKMYLSLLIFVFFANIAFSTNATVNSPQPIAKEEYSQFVEEKKIVVVITSYNNEKYCRRNLTSVFKQNYSNYRIIYVNDCSSDNTLEKAQSFINNYNQNHRTLLIHNKARLKAMENYYNAIHLCDDDEIIVILDGDDWLAHNDVLKIINYVYSTSDTWITYGQFKPARGCWSGWCRPLTCTQTQFRTTSWVTSHLRTFYAKLFKKIKIEDFYYNNKFVEVACDIAMMFPMVEMAWGHVRFIPNILYIYNNENPINDHKNNQRLYQQRVHRYFKALRPYSKLEKLF